MDPSGKSMLTNPKYCTELTYDDTSTYLVEQIATVLTSAVRDREDEPDVEDEPAVRALSTKIFSEEQCEQLFDCSPKKRNRAARCDPEDAARRMLARYIADADWKTQGSTRLAFDAGKWWRETGIGLFGEPLYVVFCSVTGTMNTSCGSESLFSLTGQYLSAHRSATASRLVEMRAFSKRNIRLRPELEAIPKLTYAEAELLIPGWEDPDATW
jgi:hypothetical protein